MANGKDPLTLTAMTAFYATPELARKALNTKLPYLGQWYRGTHRLYMFSSHEPAFLVRRGYSLAAGQTARKAE